jgi:arsenite methyltransferase
MQSDRYHEAIEAAGFHVDTVREYTAYRFVSDRANDATTKYGVSSVSLLAHRT